MAGNRPTPFVDRDAVIASLQAELAGLAGIAQAYAEVQRRCERAEEMTAWAERDAERADREAMEARAMMDRARMEVHAEKCVANYRERTWAAERELEVTQRVRDTWREAYKELNEAIANHGRGDIDGFELSLKRVEIADALEREGIS